MANLVRILGVGLALSMVGTKADICQNGATLHGSGFIVPDIANLDDFTLETRISIRNFNAHGIIFWLDVGNLRYHTIGGSRLVFDFAAWASRTGGTDHLPYIRCVPPREVDYKIPFHIAATATGDRNNPDMTMYFNGVQASCQRRNDNPGGTYNTDSIGAHAQDGQDGSISTHHLMDATLYQTRVWETVRSQQQIADLMMLPATVDMQGLLASWNYEYAEFQQGGNVPDLTGRYNGTFEFLTGGAHCNSVDPAILGLIGTLETDLTQLTDIVNNKSVAQADINMDVMDAISSLALDTFTNATMMADNIHSVLSQQASTMMDQQSTIISLQSQMNTLSSSQSSTIASLQSQIQSQASSLNDMTNRISDAGTLPQPNTQTPSCTGTSCPTPAIMAEDTDLVFVANAARFQFTGCDADICNIANEVSVLRSKLSSLKV